MIQCCVFDMKAISLCVYSLLLDYFLMVDCVVIVIAKQVVWNVGGMPWVVTLLN